MIHHDSNLFYDIYNTMNRHNQKTKSLSFIIDSPKPIWYLERTDSHSSSITSSVSSPS